MTTIMAEPVQAGAMDRASRELRWTSEQFYRAARAGVFDDPGRLELIHGRIIQKMPQSPLHTAVRRRVARVLQTALPMLCVFQENPLHIAFDGEPIPDVVVVRGPEDAYQERHPQPDDVGLVVEIAVSSAVSDLNEKALLYSSVDIAEYWVVLPEAQAIIMHREPTAQGFQNVRRVGDAETLTPLASPGAALSVRDLLGR